MGDRYGGVQALAPRLLVGAGVPDAPTARRAVAVLCAVPALLALALEAGAAAPPVVLSGLAVFGLVFALNSAIHSYLVLAYADGERVALDVGFYYMANAAGRLLGTVLSGYAYQAHGLAGCLWVATVLLIGAWVCSLVLPRVGVAAALERAHEAAPDLSVRRARVWLATAVVAGANARGRPVRGPAGPPATHQCRQGSTASVVVAVPVTIDIPMRRPRALRRLPERAHPERGDAIRAWVEHATACRRDSLAAVAWVRTAARIGAQVDEAAYRACLADGPVVEVEIDP